MKIFTNFTFLFNDEMNLMFRQFIDIIKACDFASIKTSKPATNETSTKIPLPS